MSDKAEMIVALAVGAFCLWLWVSEETPAQKQHRKAEVHRMIVLSCEASSATPYQANACVALAESP
jgi:hypothetical protein